MFAPKSASVVALGIRKFALQHPESLRADQVAVAMTTHAEV